MNICNKIKLYIKYALDIAIDLEQSDNQIEHEYKYYKLGIKYAYDSDGVNYYESKILKATSILQVYRYFLYDTTFDDIRLLEAFIGMTDCFYVSKIPEDGDDFCVFLWNCDSYKVNNINMFAQYDEVLRDRYNSVAMELENLYFGDDVRKFSDIAFKYPKSENDKIDAKLCIEKTRLKKDVFLHLYKCDSVETIVKDETEYYDLLEALNKFFMGNKMMGKIHLDIMEENHVFLTI